MFLTRSARIPRTVVTRRLLSAGKASGTPSTGSSQPILLKSRKNGVLTLTMNSPKNLNAWSLQMLNEVLNGFKEGANDKDIKVKIVNNVLDVFTYMVF